MHVVLFHVIYCIASGTQRLIGPRGNTYLAYQRPRVLTVVLCGTLYLAYGHLGFWGALLLCSMDSREVQQRAPHPPQPRPSLRPRKIKPPETSAVHHRASSSPLLFPALPCVLAGPPSHTFPGRHRPPPPPDTPARPCSQSRKTADLSALRRRFTPPPSQSLHGSQRGARTTTVTNANSATTSARTTAEKSALKQALHRLGTPGKSRSAGAVGKQRPPSSPPW